MRQVLWLSLSALSVFSACGGGAANRSADSSDLQLLLRNPENSGPQCIHEAELPRELPPDAPERIDFAQIVVSHEGAEGAGGQERSRAEACLRATEVREKLIGGGEWPAVYAKYSDHKQKDDGTLTDVAPGSLDPQLAGAAFSLEVDALSHPVATKRGFHVVWRKK